MAQLLLTDISIRQLKPSDRQVTYWDTNLPGFGIRLSPGGTKAFVLMRGKERKLHTLGRYPAMSLKNARKAAMGHQVGPTGQDGAFLAAREAIELFLSQAENRLKPRTIRDYTRLLAKLPSRKLGELTRRDLAVLLEDLPPVERFHAHAAFRSFLNWCVHEGHLATSPMPKHTGAMPKARERVLTDNELKTLLEKAPTDTFGQLVRALIYTGQRRGEIAALRWEWIAETTITLPSEITKNGISHCFPLSGLMRALLAQLPRTHALAFPSETGKIISGWSKFKARLDTATGVTGYTLHDLRRSFVSIHARIGTPIHVGEKLVNHISGTFGGVRGIYDRHTYLPEMETALLRYDEFLTNLTKPGQQQATRGPERDDANEEANI